MTLKEREQQYKEQQQLRLKKIKAEPNNFKRFWKWFWLLITFPYIWIWENIHDWHTAVIFGIVVAVVGSEVWIPLLLGIMFDNAWLIGIAITCESFWLMPCTPFLILCVGITMGIKALWNKKKAKKEKAKNE